MSAIIQGGVGSDSVLPKGSIWGLTLSNNATDGTNDIDITGGQCADSIGTVDIRFTGSLTKQLDANWAVGTNQGGRDTGAIADAWWHVFLIKNPATGVVDALFSQSATAPTMPSGFTAFRRIGSVMRTGAALKTFLQLGDQFNMSWGAIFSTSSSRSLSLFGVHCPPYVVSFPILGFELTLPTNNAATFQVASGFSSYYTISSLGKQAIGGAVGTDFISYVSTNLVSQIYMAVLLPIAPTTCNLYQYGYYDNRGKDGYSP